MHVALQHHLLDGELEPLRIDGRRPGDDAVVGGGALAPVGGRGRVRVPHRPRGGPGDRVLRQPVEQFVGDAADDQLAGPVGHAVDPDDEAAGGQAAQMVVALQQHDVGAGPRGRNGRSGAGRAAAHHQHVAVAEDGDVAGRFVHHAAGRARRAISRPAEKMSDWKKNDWLV